LSLEESKYECPYCGYKILLSVLLDAWIDDIIVKKTKDVKASTWEICPECGKDFRIVWRLDKIVKG